MTKPMAGTMALSGPDRTKLRIPAANGGIRTDPEATNAGAAAAQLCAQALLRGNADRRYTLPIVHPISIGVIRWGEEWGWLRRSPNGVELLAAGIYVGKEILNLPR